jgi:hypothetical protein
MKLTVGPLPPAVYWRRRAAILGTLLVVVFMLVYSCSSRSDASRKGRSATTATSSPSTPHSTPPTGSPSSPIFSPGGAISQQTDDPVDPGPAVSSDADRSAAPIGPCADADMTVTASAEPASVARGAFVRFTLRVKNTSNRSCTRDVGADAQELYLEDSANAKVWSSDACDPLHGTDVRTFKPADQADFFVVWNGRASNAGCVNRQPPAAATYRLVGRLNGKLSEPAPVELK